MLFKKQLLLQGRGGINKSINLLQKGYVDVYTDWAKRVDSNWSLEGYFIFPDVFYGDGTTIQPVKFPVDKTWIYDGETAKLTSSISGALIDLAANRQINRSIATNKTYDYKLNNNIIKTNGCWVFSVVLNRNIANIIICGNGFPPIPQTSQYIVSFKNSSGDTTYGLRFYMV